MGVWYFSIMSNRSSRATFCLSCHSLRVVFYLYSLFRGLYLSPVIVQGFLSGALVIFGTLVLYFSGDWQFFSQGLLVFSLVVWFLFLCVFNHSSRDFFRDLVLYYCNGGGFDTFLIGQQYFKGFFFFPWWFGITMGAYRFRKLSRVYCFFVGGLVSVSSRSSRVSFCL